VGTYWLYTCLHVSAGARVAHGAAAAALVGIMRPIAPRSALCEPLLDEAGNDARLAVLPALWVLLEWLRGWAFSVFRAVAGFAFIDSPLAGWAPMLAFTE